MNGPWKLFIMTRSEISKNWLKIILNHHRSIQTLFKRYFSRYEKHFEIKINKYHQLRHTSLCTAHPIQLDAQTFCKNTVYKNCKTQISQVFKNWSRIISNSLFQIVYFKITKQLCMNYREELFIMILWLQVIRRRYFQLKQMHNFFTVQSLKD